MGLIRDSKLNDLIIIICGVFVRSYIFYLLRQQQAHQIFFHSKDPETTDTDF